MKPVHRTPAEFWSRVPSRPALGCWPWEGSLRNRYGEFHFYGAPNRILAHREAWRLVHGEIPKGGLVCHTCDNPLCVRPSHLFLGTSTDNARDCANKGRTALNGAKLTKSQVSSLRKEWGVPLGSPPWTRGRVPITTLAARHGFTRIHMSRVLRGQCWAPRASRTVAQARPAQSRRARSYERALPSPTPLPPAAPQNSPWAWGHE